MKLLILNVIHRYLCWDDPKIKLFYHNKNSIDLPFYKKKKMIFHRKILK